MKTLNLSPEHLKSIRLTMAQSICQHWPNIFKKTFSDKPYVMNEEEYLVSKTLETLCQLEPSIKTQLAYYYK